MQTGSCPGMATPYLERNTSVLNNEHVELTIFNRKHYEAINI